MGKTKAEIAEEVRAEHLQTAKRTSDAELLEWSQNVFEQLKEAERAMVAARKYFQELENARKEARLAHRLSDSDPEKAATWRATVADADAAQIVLRDSRDERNRVQALSEMLAALLRQRRARAEDIYKRPTKATRTQVHAPVETCPFCEHTYTVRDGTVPQTDAEGNRRQLRKCQCRAMAPPCRNCPVCKENATVMTAKGDEQLRLCREHLQCEVCACECCGAGKWIEGDEDSRQKYKERAIKRHAELSAILNSSWSGGEGSHHQGGSASMRPLPLRRLPADIKNQLEAAAAAESLQFSLFDAPSKSRSNAAASGLGCGRVCCGETLVVKRRRLPRGEAVASAQPSAAGAKEETSEGCGAGCTHSHHDHDHGHYHHHHHEEDSHDVEDAFAAAAATLPTAPTAAEEHQQQSDEQETKPDEHQHVHRCEHPHDECTSSCCSAAGIL